MNFVLCGCFGDGAALLSGFWRVRRRVRLARSAWRASRRTRAQEIGFPKESRTPGLCLYWFLYL